MTKSIQSVLRVLGTLALLFSWGCQGQIEGNASSDADLSEDETLRVINGLEVYGEQGCAACHCNDASGGCNLNAPALQGNEYPASVLRQRLFQLIGEGGGLDHPLKLEESDLRPGAIDGLQAFVRRVGSRADALGNPSQISLGYNLYNQGGCINCHLSSAQGDVQNGNGLPIAGTSPENIYTTLTGSESCSHPVRLSTVDPNCPGATPTITGDHPTFGAAIRALTDIAEPDFDDDRAYLGFFLNFVAPVPVAGIQVCENRPGEICTMVGAGPGAFNGDDQVGLSAFAYFPIEVEGVDWDRDGDLELAIVDWNNHRQRVVDIDEMTASAADPEVLIYNRIFSIAGTGKVVGTDALNHPTDIAFDAAGELIQANWHNQNMYHHTNQLVDGADREQWAGLCDLACSDDAAGPTLVGETMIALPSSVQFHPDGRVFFAEGGCSRIRILDVRDVPVETVQPFSCLHPIKQRSQGTITTLAGGVNCGVDPVTGIDECVPDNGYVGDGGPAIEARFRLVNEPVVVEMGIHFSPFVAGESEPEFLYVADTQNNVIRRIRLSDNTIELFAGFPDNTQAGFADGDRLTAARFNRPANLTVAPNGDVYVADTRNNRIRKIDVTTGMVSTVAGVGRAGFNGDNQPALEAAINSPGGAWVHPDGRVFFVDTLNSRVRYVCPAEGCVAPPPEAQAQLEALETD